MIKISRNLTTTNKQARDPLDNKMADPSIVSNQLEEDVPVNNANNVREVGTKPGENLRPRIQSNILNKLKGKEEENDEFEEEVKIRTSTNFLKKLRYET